MATWQKPKIARQDKWEKQQEDMAKEIWEMETQQKYMTTWTRPGGNIRKKIDYSAINVKYRNMTRKTQSNIRRHANMNQNQQRRVKTMQSYYNAAKKYKKPTPSETGARLKYDVNVLLLRPEKLKQEYRKREQESETENLQEAQQEWMGWADYQRTLWGCSKKHTHSARGRRLRRNQNGHSD